MSASEIAISIASSLIVSALSSAGVLKFGANTIKERWLKQVEAKHNHDLEQLKDELTREQKRLQVRLDHVTIVSRTQFDAEFSAMREIYGLATAVRIAMSNVRPDRMRRVMSDDEEKRKLEFQNAYKELVEAFNPFSNQLESLKPFYPAELHLVLTEMRKTVGTEFRQLDFQLRKPFSAEWYEEGQQNLAAVISAYDHAANLIRQRLQTLSLLPSQKEAL